MPQRQRQKQQKQKPNLSPNLLNDTPTEYVAITSVFIRLIFIVQALFLVVIALNIYQNISIEKYKKEISTLERPLEQKFDVFNQVKTLNNKISLYKQVTSKKVSFSPRIDTVFSSQVAGIVFNSIEITKTEANIDFTADEVIRVTSVITNLATNDNVSEIILESVMLNRETHSFNVKLKVNFK